MSNGQIQPSSYIAPPDSPEYHNTTFQDELLSHMYSLNNMYSMWSAMIQAHNFTEEKVIAAMFASLRQHTNDIQEAIRRHFIELDKVDKINTPPVLDLRLAQLSLSKLIHETISEMARLIPNYVPDEAKEYFSHIKELLTESLLNVERAYSRYLADNSKHLSNTYCDECDGYCSFGAARRYGRKLERNNFHKEQIAHGLTYVGMGELSSILMYVHGKLGPESTQHVVDAIRLVLGSSNIPYEYKSQEDAKDNILKCKVEAVGPAPQTTGNTNRLMHNHSLGYGQEALDYSEDSDELLNSPF